MNGENLKKANEELHRINHANQELYKQLKTALREKDGELIQQTIKIDQLAKALEDKNANVQDYSKHIEKQEFDYNCKIEELRINEHKYQEKIESMSEKVKLLTNEKLSLQKVIMNYESQNVE